MSATRDGSETPTSVSAQVEEEFRDEFDRALSQAKLDGIVDMDVNRSDAIRRLMRKAIDDPSLLVEADDE